MMTQHRIESFFWGTLPDGRFVMLYRLIHRNGMELEVLNYGGIIRSLKVPDRAGKFENIVLGYNTLEDYIQYSPYFGALVGRYANRIAYGKYTASNREVQLAVNHGVHHLHGGHQGFDKALWEIFPKQTDNSLALTLRHLSPNGAEGFPGNLAVEVVYRITDDFRLEICYSATSDRETIVNLTSHSYFNLSGNLKNPIGNHQLQIEATEVLEVDPDLIPTGKYTSVKATPMDFRQLRTIGISEAYDHCFVAQDSSQELGKIARVEEPISGRYMEVWTDQPSVQLYIPQSLPDPFIPYGGFCLETQNFPDAPNHSHFPSAFVSKGNQYSTQTHYCFGQLPQ